MRENIYTKKGRKENNFSYRYFGSKAGICALSNLICKLIDNVSTIAVKRYIDVLYFTDDIILLAAFITELERQLHACERELEWLDMSINYKKSCCLRIGPYHDVKCADVVSLSGCVLSWVCELRYTLVFML